MAKANLSSFKMMNTLSQDIAARLRKCRFLVAITGAGISAASGLPVLSEKVEGVPLTAFFQPELYRLEPEKYFSVYRAAVSKWRKASPNEAHYSLAKAGAWIITQNVDGLHRDAGSEHVIELHGNLRELRCPHCSLIFSCDLAFENSVPHCPECDDVLYPGITLEGEEVRHFSRALDWVGRAQEALVIGTKLEMDPVRRLPQVLQEHGVNVVFINNQAEEMVPALLTGRGVEPKYV